MVLQAARGPAPSLAEAVAGEPIRGSWWGHPAGHEIFRLAEAVTAHEDVLVCKLLDGKVTYVHRRLWPALVRLASRLPRSGLARVWSEHTSRGHHRARREAFPKWVPPEVRAASDRLSAEQAQAALAPWLDAIASPRSRRSRAR